MSVADTLREARRRIEEPEKWGKREEVQAGNRAKTCPFFAIFDDQPAVDFDTRESGIELFMKAIGARTSCGIATWNDAPGRTHADVMAAFDRAIALAESAEEKT